MSLVSDAPSGGEVRGAFLDFFAQRDHLVVPGASLVPHNDDSLLFINAGMAPFKPIFLGEETAPAERCVSSQPCLRAGGKHNDLAEVGRTERHHTFFEMLGNFSFGDYFKEQAIVYAWEFLTGTLGLPAEKLLVTVHHSDNESAELWSKVAGVPNGEIRRLGDADNLWMMGESGPCGPCSEVFYDRGDDIPGGPPGAPDEGERWVEVWNLVFMQWLREAGGVQRDLPRRCVDTGMGLERLTAVMQGVRSNYDTDLFLSLREEIRAQLGASGDAGVSERVVADHIRAISFLIADGIRPSNEGRGYVLRRILRRASRHASKIAGGEGKGQDVLSRLAVKLADVMGDAYPKLVKEQQSIASTIAQEEAMFADTLQRGLRIFEREHSKIAASKSVPGALAFLLYDSYGFPLDMTQDMAEERGWQVDVAGFEREMQAQRERARASSAFKADASVLARIELPENAESDSSSPFVGYERLETNSKVLGLWTESGEAIEELARSGEEGFVLLDHTGFYAESGGQIGDIGYLHSLSGDCRVKVVDCQSVRSQNLHLVRLEEGALKCDTEVVATADSVHRAAVARAHSATHLLHAALENHLGGEVKQMGSWVGPDRLRFDFTHPQKVSAETLQSIETEVQGHILENSAVETSVMALEDAKKSGAHALFGERYGEQVRVLDMAQGYSRELCGGTHVKRLGDIGMLWITAESSVAVGVRRIEACTGNIAFGQVQADRERWKALSGNLKCGTAEVENRIDSLRDEITALKQREADLQRKLMSGASGGQRDAVEVSLPDGAGVARLVLQRIDGLRGKAVRTALSDMETKLAAKGEHWAVLLAAVDDEKCILMAAVSEALRTNLAAVDLLSWVASPLGGRGGGDAGFARGGGGEVAGLDAALDKAAHQFKESGEVGFT